MRLRLGMVGGGPGAFIGGVHRMAAALDGDFDLVAGAFSSNPARSEETGRSLGLDPSRVYGSFEEMARGEHALPEPARIQVVSIVTPNHLHHAVAKAFLECGIHVVCDKPLTTTIEDAEELCHLAAERALVFALTHNYTGYPMVKEARARVRAGSLGSLRKVVVEYSQGWLRTLLEAEGQKQAEWRGDPDRAGVSSALADIGSHAHNLVRYVTGLEVTRLFADLGTVVVGRAMEDDATVLLELEGGVRAVLMASQISTGERNHLRLRAYGSDRALDWCQEDPDRLRLVGPDGGEEIVFRGDPSLSMEAQSATRLPAGHPEGFIEAFANIYRGVAQAVRNSVATAAVGPHAGVGAASPAPGLDFPTVRDGAFGVHFIHRAVESAARGTWIDMTYEPPGKESP
ncbi:MAG: Gfo/Idh/MocA family oxidoreductase [Gemmatimonadota bacterium]|nr:Gfo/Idh/MocA family oxidoreductase [Gemmatimonadota bacterium]MDH3424485.1 Gfo/Idh/MocA family oxidoreductase [Gemmatimonadota bacterium]